MAKDVLSFRSLTKKHRKAVTLKACLSLTAYAAQVDFLMANMLGGIASVQEDSEMTQMRKTIPGKATVKGMYSD